MFHRVIALIVFLTFCLNAKPLEPYGDYLIVVVHGIHTNYKFDKSVCLPCLSMQDCDSVKQKTIDTLRLETGLKTDSFGVTISEFISMYIDSTQNDDTTTTYDTTYDTSRSVCYQKTVYEEDQKASNLFDPGKDPLDLDFGDFKGYLENDLGMTGHVYSYNFDRPAETYYSTDTAKSTMSLARQFGDRDSSFSFQTGDYKLFPTYHPNIDLHDQWFYQNETKKEDSLALPNRGTATDLCWLEKALEDWKWYYVNQNPRDDIREPSQIPDSLYPRKYLIIAQSMGGLVTRGYIVSKFYKNDIDKVVTIDTPHEGSDIITMIKNYAKMRSGDYYKDQLISMVKQMAVGNPNSSMMLGNWVWQAIWDKIYANIYKSYITDYDGNETGLNDLVPTSDFVHKFNNTLPVDSNAHIPMFRLIMSTGTPTIETELTNAMYYQNKYAFMSNGTTHGNSSYMLPTFGTYWNEFSWFDKYWAMLNAGILNDETGTALGMPLAIRFPGLCVLGQWGDVFVPEWSQQAKSVELFKISDTKRWLMDMKKIHNRSDAYLDKINNVSSVWNVLFKMSSDLGFLLPKQVYNTLQTTLAWGQHLYDSTLVYRRRNGVWS